MRCASKTQYMFYIYLWKSGGSGISNMTSSYIRGYKIDYKYFRKCWYGFKDIKYYVTILAYYIFRTDLILPCLVLVPQQDSLSWQFFLDFFQQMKQFVVISLFLQNLLLSLIICKFYFKLQLEIFKLELKLKWVVMNFIIWKRHFTEKIALIMNK